ncbi:MAG: flavodoxin-dependent (E)-4-hydroxy-3-methylbut-2-enyl-diphosphate synthase [Deltaproteobacteria bacterium]|nr:MAG: flavodoxin-dependent (E)-4-hydroxy-3-methylbut-2-enyl-diphosphate synthase [Deltaproteobacteria bacterium]
MVERRQSRQISVGGIKVGGGAPISVQSMTNTDTRDTAATVAQIHRLEEVGCEIVRVAVPDRPAAENLREIKTRINIPLVADIHFDYRLALEAIAQGVDGLRLNPGNIGDKGRVKEIVKEAKEKEIPIRIGVNAGSLEKDLLSKYGCSGPEGMVESALRHIRILEDLGFYQMKISLKASEVLATIGAYRMIAERVDYPLHLGVTEAGSLFTGTIKSAVGMGVLLAEGIGDTIRVSLTGEPEEEVRVGYGILRSLGLRRRGIELISCPTCGRDEIGVIELSREIEKKLAHIASPVKVALMGCVVNGPGEAVQADVGIAGGKGTVMLYLKGKAEGKIKREDIVKVLVKEVTRISEEMR